jgi:pimeloyl-ACP methyl ester carboxylesterase
MKKILPFILIALVINSCQRLDSNLYNPTKVKGYFQDAYTGEVDFKLENDTNQIIPITKQPLNYYFFGVSRTKKEVDANAEPKYVCANVLSRNYRNLKNDTVIVYCHGNRDHMDFYWPRVKLLANLLPLDTNIIVYEKSGKKKLTGGLPKNYTIVTFDYRGYGLSKGTPSEEAMYADLRSIIYELKTKGMKSENFILYGFSLGCAPVIKIAAEGADVNPSKIIIEAPFASSKAMVQDASAINMPKSYFTDLSIDNAEEIKKVKQPLMWIHGDADDFLDIDEHGKVVYNNYVGTYKEAHIIKGAGHSTIQTTWGFKEYNQAVLSFIRKKI